MKHTDEYELHGDTVAMLLVQCSDGEFLATIVSSDCTLPALRCLCAVKLQVNNGQVWMAFQGQHAVAPVNTRKPSLQAHSSAVSSPSTALTTRRNVPPPGVFRDAPPITTSTAVPGHARHAGEAEGYFWWSAATAQRLPVPA